MGLPLNQWVNVNRYLRYPKYYELTLEELNWLSSEVAKLQELTKEVCTTALNEISE